MKLVFYFFLPTLLIFPFFTTAQSLEQQNALKLLDQGLFHFEERDALPEQRRFGRDRTDAQQDLDKLVDSAIQILGSPDILLLLENIREIDALTTEQMDIVADLGEQRLFAPSVIEDQGVLKRLFSFSKPRTKDDFTGLIEAHEENIKRYSTDQALLKREIYMKLRDLDVPVSYQHIDSIVASSISDSVLNNIFLFHNIAELTEKLAELTVRSGENPATAKRYYGMMIIMHLMVKHANTEFVAQIENQAIPKLRDIREEARTVIRSSEALIREEPSRLLAGTDSSPQLQTLRANVSANQLTIDAIELYLERLYKMIDRSTQTIQENNRNLDIAINTYRTVSLSVSVLELIREGTSTFNRVLSMNIPEPIIFENEELRREFVRLSERMRADQ